MAYSNVRIQVIGNVRSVKLVTIADTKRKLEFSIPHSEGYKDKQTGEWKNYPTTWYNMQIWGNEDSKAFQRAVRLITEGAFIVIDNCKMKEEQYENKKGEVVKTTKFLVSLFDWHVPESRDMASAPVSTPSTSPAEDDDLVF